MQNNAFPERNTVYDFCFDKKASGQWIDWMDTLDKSSLNIPPSSKVSSITGQLRLYVPMFSVCQLPDLHNQPCYNVMFNSPYFFLVVEITT